MNILHITPVYLPFWQYGGPIRSTHLLARGHAAKGHKVDVVTTSTGTPDASSTEVVSRMIDGVTVHYCPARTTRLGILSPQMASIARPIAEKADITHITAVWQPSIISVHRMLRTLKAPYVVSPRGSLSSFSFQHRAWKKWPYYFLFERPIERGASIIHATALLERDELHSLGFRVPIYIIPNACDSSVWFYDPAGRNEWRTSRGINPDEFLIMHAGRVHPKKNISFLAEAAASLPVDAQWRVAVVGPVADRDLPYLKALQKHLPPRRLLIDSGTGDNNLLRGAYSAADCMALPSVSENFGNVVIESLLCQTPVISSPHIGASQFVAAFGGVDILDLNLLLWSQELTNRVQRTNRDRLAQGVRQRIAAMFSEQTVSDQCEAMYRSALQCDTRLVRGVKADPCR